MSWFVLELDLQREIDNNHDRDEHIAINRERTTSSNIHTITQVPNPCITARKGVRQAYPNTQQSLQQTMHVMFMHS